MYYRRCPDCGAYLDPDERCDCKDEAATAGTVTASKWKANDNELQAHYSTMGGKIKEAKTWKA